MKTWMKGARCILAALAIVTLASSLAYAQGGSTTTVLSGTVTDASGGVIPGANVVVKNNATTAQYEAVTGANGAFTVPALPPGTYTVTISLSGFKTWTSPDVKLLAATPGAIKAMLEVGKLEETVVVEGATEIVQTQTAAVQTTLVAQQIQQLPLVTHTALDFVTALPGVQTVGAGSRSSTINGLPGVTINITLDGVNVQDNNNRGPAGGNDGFFMYIRPMLDSVEEITVSTSTPGAESAGQGASQIRMVTRSGSNTFTGSAYNTWRNQAGISESDLKTRKDKPGFLWRLNTPYWFNMRDVAKQANGKYFIDDARLQTPGFRVGGPIMRDKAFFFFHYEEFRWPFQMSRNRYLLGQNAQTGVFTYKANDGSTRTLDLLKLAATNNQVSTVDPTISRLLADIRSAAGTTGGIDETYDLNVSKLTYSPGGKQKRYFPTVRVDYNLTNAHRVTLSTRYNRFNAGPDFLNGAEPRFPDFANWGGQYSHRYMAQATLRSTIGSNMVNEARGGWNGGTTQWYPEFTRSQFDCSGLGCQGPWNMVFGSNSYLMGSNALTGPTTGTGPSSRNVPGITFEDTLSMIRGAHSFSAGMSFTQFRFNNWGVPGTNGSGLVPTLNFGVVSTDPAYKMLASDSGNYPGGISDTYAGYARNLYALLTGRVTQMSGLATLGGDNSYHFLGDRWQRGRLNELGLFLSDSWRLRPNLTLTYGVRWELQLPFTPDTASWARLSDPAMIYGASGALFRPGALAGIAPSLEAYKPGDKAYNTDWNNVAPALGIAWRPQLGENWLTRIISTQPVLRGGYSIAYTRYGTGDFTGVYGTNPGGTRDASVSIANGTLGTDGQGLPVLFRQTSRLQPGSYPSAPTYPFTPAKNESLAVMDPNLKVPYAHQYSIGWAREFGKTIGVELRYVGNRFVGGWTTENLINSRNWSMIENGFMNEFKLAQANLQANIRAGKGNTFAYTGVAGTSPLPIFQAYFAGIARGDTAKNGDPKTYTSSNYTSSSWYNQLKLYDPNPSGMAGTGTSGLQNQTYASNAAKAGLPADFFMANPSQFQANNVNLLYNGGPTKYDGLQFDLRRRMADGFLLQGSYVFGRSYNSTRPTMRNDWIRQLSTGGVDHAFKINWVYQLPFGQGKAVGGGVSNWVNQIIGGWEFDGAGRVQSGQILNFNNVRLVGMTDADLQSIYKVYHRVDSKGVERIYMLPEDVITNSIIALNNASATSATGYTGTLPTGRYFAPASSPDCVQAYNGQCPGTLNHFVRGPWSSRFDMSFVKRFKLGGARFLEARMDLYNVFNTINFNPVTYSQSGGSVSAWEVTSAFRDANASQDPGGRITSFALRFTF